MANEVTILASDDTLLFNVDESKHLESRRCWCCAVGNIQNFQTGNINRTNERSLFLTTSFNHFSSLLQLIRFRRGGGGGGLGKKGRHWIIILG